MVLHAGGSRVWYVQGFSRQKNSPVSYGCKNMLVESPSRPIFRSPDQSIHRAMNPQTVQGVNLHPSVKLNLTRTVVQAFLLMRIMVLIL